MECLMNTPSTNTCPLNLVLLALSVLQLTACASNVPAIIKNPPPEDLSLTRVRHAPAKHLNKFIRWGGTIISTQNQQDKTELIILATPLDKFGEPQQGDQSYGRFIGVIDGFLDPAIYATGRAITVYGKFEKVIRRKIDNFEYDYPVIQIEHFYLWEVPEKYDYYDYPYWYDPWYPYPYWHPYYHPYGHRY